MASPKGKIIGQEGTILLVEDNQDDIDLTLRAFEKNNILNEIAVAKDGTEALEYLFGDREPPILVLLDLNLPKVDGMEVLRQIRTNESTKTLLVVILTSSKEEKDLIDGYNLGVNSYIRKPVDFDQFIESVQQLGLYWLLLNVPPPK